jgi:hypothetical protein
MSRIYRQLAPPGTRLGIAFSGGLDTRCAVARYPSRQRPSPKRETGPRGGSSSRSSRPPPSSSRNRKCCRLSCSARRSGTSTSYCNRSTASMGVAGALRGFLAHCRNEGLVKKVPAPPPIKGRKRRGKPQLRIDEARKLVAEALRRGDPLALAAATMGAWLWSMCPARSSASIDIGLPGMTSSVKRAATSATRSDPFEITMNWFIVQTSPSRGAAFSPQIGRFSAEIDASSNGRRWRMSGRAPLADRAAAPTLGSTTHASTPRPGPTPSSLPATSGSSPCSTASPNPPPIGSTPDPPGPRPGG